MVSFARAKTTIIFFLNVVLMIKKLVISIPRWVIFSHRSARGPPSPRGGRGAQLHRHQGDVALPVARETARADPRVPGALRPCREWRISRPAPH